MGIFIAAGGLILITTLLVSYFNSTALLRTNAAVERTYQVMNELHLLVMDLKKIQVNGRVYMITRDSYALTGFSEYVADGEARLSRLRDLVVENPGHQAALDSLAEMFASHLTVNDVLATTVSVELDQQLLVPAFKKSKSFEDQFVARVDRFREQQEALLAVRKADGARTLIRFQWLFAVDLGLIALLAVLIMTVSRRNEDLRQKILVDNVKLQQSLKETHAYKYALDESAIVAITDRFGRITYVNENFCKISKYSRDELIGKDHRIINSGYHSKDYVRRVWDTIQAGRVWKGDFRNRASDGSFYWVDTNIIPFLDESGKPYQYLAIRYDITQKKQAELMAARNRVLEMEISEKSAQLSEVLQRITDGFIVLDRNFVYRYVNDKVTEMTGHTREQLIGKNVWEIFPDAVGSATYVAFHKALSEQCFVSHVDYYAPLDLWQENFIYPSDEGLSVFVRDVTQQKRAEQKLIESERLYRFIASNIPGSAISLVDRDTKVLLIEGDMVEKIGYSREKLFGKRLTDMVPKHRMDEIKPFLDRAFAGETFSVELPRAGYDFLVCYVPLKEEDGAINIVLTISIDVTELKKAQKAIQEMNEQLEQRIAARTEQLAAANKEMESFSYSVAHDLRTPLRGVAGYANMLVEDYSPVLDDEGKRLLNEMGHNVSRMGRLIDDLLEFSRLGRKAVNKTMVNMKELVNVVIAELEPDRAEVRCGELLPVAADFSLMRHVMTNLISNAIKYSSKKEHPLIEISSEQKGDNIIYTVKDNGAGFDMRYVDKLFGVFQRLHSGDEFEGTGVGLAIVQRIVLRHGGKVSAVGKLNEGATFQISLPVEKLDQIA